MKQNNLLDRLFLVLIGIFLYAPIAVLIVFSFNATSSRTVWGGFSLTWYVELFQNDALMEAVQTTMTVSAISAVIACIFGTAAAIGIHSMRRKSRSVVMAVNNIPLTNADIITGVSMSLLFGLAITVWNGSLGDLLGISWSMGMGTLVIAHITFNVPYVILSVLPRLRQLDPNLFEAAQDLGATNLQAFYKVILPDLMPGIINGFLLALTMSIDDFLISYFTAGTRVSTLAMEIYAMARRKISPEINAISTLLFVSVLLLLVIINIRQARQEALRKRQKANLQ
ncbi:ABC transporter permease [Bengtsoniella intestinalis]|uniref:ABC transporter permease n=1 Tax=Bengtsoniella intestinalis TaxID=3073143 RepID=UPI00391F1C88